MKALRISLIAALLAAPPAFAAEMGDMKMGSPSTMQNSQAHHATGVIRKVDAANQRLVIAHQPVKSLNWPAMTMAFRVQDKKLLDGLAEGKQVDFDFLQEGGKSIIVAIRPR